MSQRAIVMCVALFVVIVVGMFSFIYIKQHEIEKTPQVKTITPKDKLSEASITRIDAKHFFVNGVHTLAGVIPFPTPCDLLEVTAQVAKSLPEQVSVNFSVINTAKTCAQSITMQRFKVSAQANEGAQFKAFIMGKPVELNLIPAGKGETPDSFELFSKG